MNELKKKWFFSIEIKNLNKLVDARKIKLAEL